MEFEMDTRKQIELEKMKLELELLKKDLKSKENRKSTGEKIKEWLPLFLTFIGIMGGLLTFWLKADAYLREIEKENRRARFQHEINFNKEIIELSDDLNHEDPSRREYAALMLMSYNLNSVPILMFMLERQQIHNNEIYLQTLRDIFNKKSIDKEIFFERIMNATRQLFLKEYQKMNASQSSIKDINLDGIGNHIAIFEYLAQEMTKEQRLKSLNQLTRFHQKLSEKEIESNVKKIIITYIQDAQEALNRS